MEKRLEKQCHQLFLENPCMLYKIYRTNTMTDEAVPVKPKPPCTYDDNKKSYLSKGLEQLK
jgi:hypothetical protein